MKVLIDGIIYNLKKTGGIKRYFDSFLPYLTKLDKSIGVKVISSKNYFQFPIVALTTISKPLLDPINSYFKQKYLLKLKADIFHSTYYTSHPDKNIPQVITVYDMIHELYPKFFKGKRHDKFRKKKKEIVKKADAIICISENTKKDLVKLYKIKKDKISVIYPGVNVKQFTPIRQLAEKKEKIKLLKKYKITKPYFLYVGPRGRYKNFTGFIKAFSQWNKVKDFDLLCVGGNKFTKKEKILFNKLNLFNQIKNFGFVKDDDLIRFYQSAYALVYPSVYEGFGMPILEAMACGSLVLASNKASMPEAGGKAVIYFNPENSKSIIRALDRSLNKKLKQDLITKGLKRTKQFSWQKTAEQTLKVYKKVIKN